MSTIKIRPRKKVTIVVKRKKETGKLYIGSGYTQITGYTETINMAYEVDRANAMQLFLRSPQLDKSMSDMYKMKAIDIKLAKERIEESDIKVNIHSPFYVNLAKDISQPEHRWIYDHLVDDFKGATLLGAYGIVVHTGKTNTKKKRYTLKQATLNMINNIKLVLNGTEDCVVYSPQGAVNPILLLIETAAGQGSEMFPNLNDFSTFYNDLLDELSKTDGRRVKVCLDTCHMFAAGYDIRTQESAQEVITLIDNLLGWNNVALIHFNDSKDRLGSNRDNHAPIGEGCICNNELGGTLEGLALIAKKAKSMSIPMVLETSGNITNQIKLVKQLVSEKYEYDS